jgi:hypothetical protein
MQSDKNEQGRKSRVLLSLQKGRKMVQTSG